MVELASKNIGCILMFLGMIVFNSLGIDKVLTIETRREMRRL